MNKKRESPIDIIKIAREITTEILAFEKHPGKEMDLDLKLAYLNALALLMNADSEIHDREKEYLATLLYTFDIPKDKLDDLVQFSMVVDEKVMSEAMKEVFHNLPKDEIKYVFLMDCFMLSNADENYVEREKELISVYARSLKITKADEGRIFYLYQKVQKRNGSSLKTMKLDSGKLEIKIFNYLFHHFQMNIL